jgi:hypothetical protein
MQRSEKLSTRKGSMLVGALVKELVLKQFRVVPVERKKLIMGALFHDCPLVEDKNEVGVADSAQTMGNDNLSATKCLQVFFDLAFGDNVERAGCFIEQEDRR